MAEPCPDENELLDLVSGRRASPEVARHVAECPTCSLVLADAFGTPEVDALEAGTTLGRYRIVTEIGRGGTGIVYEAHDELLDRTVAIKLLRWSSSEARARLLREARLIARLDHRNVVSIFDAGESGSTLYFAMELVHGRSLRELMTKNTPQRELVRAMRDAGRGLAAAHRAGISHRDFKPANVLVSDTGRAVVVDFGLAAIGDSPIASAQSASVSLDDRLTMTGQVFGTPAYMSPEQFAGRTCDARADQFSFCASLVHVMTGALPFRGSTVAELRDAVEHARFDEGALAKLPRNVRRVVMRGLRADPAQRYSSMDALLAAFEGRRRLAIAGIAAGVVAIAVSVTAGYFARGSSTPFDPCVAAAARIDTVWTARARRDVAVALARHLPSSRVDELASRVTDWSTRWRNERNASCRAARPGVDPTADRAGLCLDGMLIELGATLDVLATANADVATMAARAIDTLPATARCAAPKPPLSTEPRAVLVKRIRDRLALLATIGRRNGTTLTVLAGTPDVGNRLYRLALPDVQIVELGPIAHAGDLWELRPHGKDQALAFDRPRDVLLVVDRRNGTTIRSQTVAGDIHHNGRGLAVSPTGALLGLFRGRELAEIDPLTGTLTPRSTLDVRFQIETMTYCTDGTLYAAGSDAPGNPVGRTLLSIDPERGTVTVIANIGESSIDIDTLECDRDGLLLFGVDTVGREQNDLYAIDPRTGARTLVATIPGPVNGLLAEPR